MKTRAKPTKSKPAKKPASEKIIALRAKLERLMASPFPGEVENAKGKLARLLDRYDFSGAPIEHDIFSNIGAAEPSSTALFCFSFATVDSDVAMASKWIIENRFRVRVLLRTAGNWASEAWVECGARSVPALTTIAETVTAHFGSLWRTMIEQAQVDDGDRRPFLLGLYDGIMDDPRAPGSMLPMRSFARKPAKIKKRALARKPGLATHPYTLALELGRKIRLRATVHETTEALVSAIAGVLPA